MSKQPHSLMPKRKALLKQVDSLIYEEVKRKNNILIAEHQSVVGKKSDKIFSPKNSPRHGSVD